MTGPGRALLLAVAVPAVSLVLSCCGFAFWLVCMCSFLAGRIDDVIFDPMRYLALAFVWAMLGCFAIRHVVDLVATRLEPVLVSVFGSASDPL